MLRQNVSMLRTSNFVVLLADVDVLESLRCLGGGGTLYRFGRRLITRHWTVRKGPPLGLGCAGLGRFIVSGLRNEVADICGNNFCQQ